MFNPERRAACRLAATAALGRLPIAAAASSSSSPSSEPSTMQAILRNDSALTTLINVFHVDPDKTDALVSLLQAGTRDWICRVPGFVSSTLHVTRDRTRVVIYGQWRDAAAIDAMRASPQMPPYFARVQALARMDAMLCDVASVVVG